MIPYANTCYADSITNGTKTVMIAGQTVAIEDVSRQGRGDWRDHWQGLLHQLVQ